MIVGNLKTNYTDLIAYNSTEKVTAKNAETEVSKAATEGVIYSTEKLLEKESRLYDKTGNTIAVASYGGFTSGQGVQQALFDLGFYSGPLDGSLSSTLTKNALKEFQCVYGMTQSGNADVTTLSKLKRAYDYNCEAIAAYRNNQELSSHFPMDSIQLDNFGMTWAFLREGMELDTMHASAVMSNIRWESGFSSDNLRDVGDNVTIHDPNYAYDVNDGKAYGLMQWCHASRKEGLLNKANSMGLHYSDINAQLAYFREETETICDVSWGQFKNIDNLHNATVYFMDNIEIPNPSHRNPAERMATADIIYNTLQGV